MPKAANFETLSTRHEKTPSTTGRHREGRFIPVDQIPGGETPLERLEALEEEGANVFSSRPQEHSGMEAMGAKTLLEENSKIISYHASPEGRPSQGRRRGKKPLKLSEAA